MRADRLRRRAGDRGQCDPAPAPALGGVRCRRCINLLAIVAFGIIFGLWGAVLGTPMAVALTVLIRMAYIEDVLEARPAAGTAAEA